MDMKEVRAAFERALRLYERGVTTMEQLAEDIDDIAASIREEIDALVAANESEQ